MPDVNVDLEYYIEKLKENESENPRCKVVRKKIEEFIENYKENDNYEEYCGTLLEVDPNNRLEYGLDVFNDERIIGKIGEEVNCVASWIAANGESEDLVDKVMELNDDQFEDLKFVCKYTNEEYIFAMYVDILQNHDQKTVYEINELIESEEVEVLENVLYTSLRIYQEFESMDMLEIFKSVNWRSYDREYFNEEPFTSFVDSELFEEKTIETIKKYLKKGVEIIATETIWELLEGNSYRHETRINNLAEDNTIDLFLKDDKVISLISSSIRYDDDSVIRNMLKKHKDHSNFEIGICDLVPMVQIGDYTHEHVILYSKVVDAYMDNLEVLEQLNENVDFVALGFLLDDQNQNILSERPEAFDFLISENYREIISQVEIAPKLLVGDLMDIRSAYNLVEQVHERRGKFHKNEILSGFFRELNRSCNQREGIEEKRKIVREYCAEVKDALMQNYDELRLQKNV